MYYDIRNRDYLILIIATDVFGNYCRPCWTRCCLDRTWNACTFECPRCQGISQTPFTCWKVASPPGHCLSITQWLAVKRPLYLPWKLWLSTFQVSGFLQRERHSVFAFCMQKMWMMSVQDQHPHDLLWFLSSQA